MVSIHQKSIVLISFFFATTVLLTFCDSTSVENSEDRSDPFCVALILNSVQIANQENGEITYNEGRNMELEVGEETNLINIRWIAEDGDCFTPDTNDGFSL